MDEEIKDECEEKRKSNGSIENRDEENYEEKDESWQNKIKSMKCGISHIYESKVFSDVEFIVGDRIFKAHRLILAARSPEFEKILFKRNAPNKIICENIPEKGFEILLKFIYTEEVKITNCEDIITAYEVALRFKQEQLIKELENLAEKWELDCDNVCTVLNQAANVSYFKEKCLQFIQNNGEDVIASKDFLKATTDSVKDMLMNNCFEKAPIIVVLRKVLQWATKQFQQLENYTIVRKHLMSNNILGRLRMHMLSTEELIQLNDEYPNFLSPSEFRKLCSYYLLLDKKDLPKWCIL